MIRSKLWMGLSQVKISLRNGGCDLFMDDQQDDFKKKAREYARQKRRESYLKAKELKKKKRAHLKEETSPEKTAWLKKQKERQREARRAAYKRQKELHQKRKEKQKDQTLAKDIAASLKLVRFDDDLQEFTPLKTPPPVLRYIKGKKK